MEADACFRGLDATVIPVIVDPEKKTIEFSDDMVGELRKVKRDRWEAARGAIEGLMANLHRSESQPYSMVQMFAGYAIADIMYEAGSNNDAATKLGMFMESVSAGLGPAAASDIGQGIDIALAAARCSMWELARHGQPSVAPPEPEPEPAPEPAPVPEAQ